MSNTPFAAVLAASALLAAHANAQTERRSLTGDRVSIYNLAGKLRVQPTGGSQVTIDVTRGGRDGASLKIATGEIRGWQSLRVIYGSDRIVYPELSNRTRTSFRVNSDGTFDDNNHEEYFNRNRVEIRDSGSGLDAHADLVVGVPKGQRIALHLGVGDATVANVDGDIRVSVAAATLSAEHTRGRLALETGSGRVEVSDATGDVSLDTGSGGVTVNGVHGDALNVDTGSGSVHGDDIDVKTLKVDVGSGGVRLGRVKADQISVDAGSGGTELDFLSAIRSLVIDAGSGGVTLHLPATQTADVDIETGSGGIQSDFDVRTTSFQRHHVRGTIGSGQSGARIRIESGSGSVRLLKR